MTIDFYYTNGSIPCRFIQLLAKNLNIELNHIYLDLTVNKDQLKPEFIKMNPQHCVPTINDNGFILWESSAIATYLIRKYSNNSTLYPNDFQKQAVVDQRLYFNMTILRRRHQECFFAALLGIGVSGAEELKRLEEAVGILECMFNQHDYIAGDCLTVADYAISTTLATSLAAGFDLSSFKNMEKWFNMIKCTVPSFQEFNNSDMINKTFAAMGKNRNL